jgi:phosphoenolpyruvate carboxylase
MTHCQMLAIETECTGITEMTNAPDHKSILTDLTGNDSAVISSDVADRDAVLDAAWQVFREVGKSPELLDALNERLNACSATVLEGRVEKLVGYVSDTDVSNNLDRLKKSLRDLAEENGSVVPMEAFVDRIGQELAGLVMTAHPTFSLSKDAWQASKARLSAVLGGDASDVQPLSLLPTSSPSLEDELEYANAAIRNVRLCLRQVWGVCIDVAKDLYPDDWKDIAPKLVTVASWVGFDLDGRTDIGWSQSLHFRYITTLMGLDELLSFWSEVSEGELSDSTNAAEVADALNVLNDTFKLGLSALEDADKSKKYGSFNRLAVERQSLKETERKRISDNIDALMASGLSDETLQKIAIFRAEWNTIGLGLSHIHFRLNAAQLHNAIRPVIDLQEAPDRSASRRHYLDTIASLLDEVETQSIHYGIVAEELTTARRVFMLAAQFRKHFDDNSSLRMLVAESDTPFTLLVALYYAKMFGVDDYVEISPLFETAIGLQRGDRVISELLDNPHFMAYIESQGRFCVQLGFSDSGRYVGQVAASLAIERFKLRLIRLWEARDLGHIQLVFFDTHGESIGRGAHPTSMTKRFLYTHSAEVRKRLNKLGNIYKHEVSYQGGDGYMWFLHPDLTLATMTDLLVTRLAKDKDEPDALYTQSDWSLDFFLTLTETQEKMADDSGYVRLIDSIGQAMLYPTGSRAVKRQGRGKLGNRLDHIGQIRAIPNNAVLQQLGYMANTIMGTGTAANRNPRRFYDVVADSERLQDLLQMTLNSLKVSNVGILGAYLSSLSPSYWLDRCDREAPSKDRSRMLKIAKSLEGVFDGNAMRSAHRTFRHDAFIYEDMLEVADLEPQTTDPLIVELHTLRIALIHFIHFKAMQVPQFSTRQDISLDEFIDALLHLNVDDALSELRRIFPNHDIADDTEDYGEDASFGAAKNVGYEKEHVEVFDRIELAYRLILKISSVIATKIGAIG